LEDNPEKLEACDHGEEDNECFMTFVLVSPIVVVLVFPHVLPILTEEKEIEQV
jgi:hypothetical protein